MKILVADDDGVSRSMMKKMLVHSGYEVVTARDGAEAVDSLLREDGPRLALLDWMMPELDGPEVCRAIRASSRKAYVYMTLLTSKDSKEDLVAGLEAGADDYLTKPCHLEELRARLRTGQRILQLEDILISAREEMRFRATHDALTLLLDRGAILHELSSALEEAHLLGNELSVILCDVDHFKKINDTYGHPVGDEVLREVAQRLKQAVRQGDAVGRYGGEEFLLILRGCGASMIRTRAEAICQSLRAKPTSTSAGAVHVSLSAGALEIARMEDAPSLERILQRVDDALYQAKKEGRDRAVISAALPAVMGLELGSSVMLPC